MKRFIAFFLTNIAVMLILMRVLFPKPGSEEALMTYRFTYIGVPVNNAHAAGIMQADELLGTSTRLTGLSQIDETRQEALIRKAVYANVDGIITRGGSDESGVLSEAFRMAEEAGIPVITLEEDLSVPGRTAFVGMDMAQAGQKAWTLLRSASGVQESDTSDVLYAVILETEDNASQMQAAEAFCQAAVQEDIREEQIILVSCGNQRQTIRQAVLDTIGACPRLRGMYLPGSLASTYVAEILESEGYGSADFAVVSTGMNSRVYEALKSGMYQRSLIYDDIREGQQAVTVLKEILEGRGSSGTDELLYVRTAGADFDYEAWTEEREKVSAEWELS